MFASLSLFVVVAVARGSINDGVALKNAANPGVVMPLAGLGTGGYGNHKYAKLGVYPECWAENQPDAGGKIPNPGVDCSREVLNATVTWLSVGGKRIDNGDSYENMLTMGKAMKASGVARKDIFLVTKVGDGGLGLGEEDCNRQVKYALGKYQTDYLDLLLIHWPTSGMNSSDPHCQEHGAKYDATACRVSTWKALLKLWKAGTAKAVGVSNFNVEHLQEIIDAGLELPSVNQCPFNPHLFTAQQDLRAMCQKHGILFNSYSPLGIPDWKKYQVGNAPGGVLIKDPRLATIGAKHNLSPAQVLLAWQAGLGMVYNPRTMSKAHMLENLDPKVGNTKLDADDLKVLAGFEPDKCSPTNGWYECCGGSQASLPHC